jgi:hypothetical protein
MFDLIDGPDDMRNAQIEVMDQILGLLAVIAGNLKRPLQQTGIVGKEHLLIRSPSGFGVRKRHIVWLYLLKGSLEEESDMATSDIRELLTFAVFPPNLRLRAQSESVMYGVCRPSRKEAACCRSPRNSRRPRDVGPRLVV